MRGYYTVEQIRVAEAALFERVPAGVPMQRAARGVATVVAEKLRERTGGVVGRRVGLLVGSGDNGGDALWAGAMLRRRGVAVTAVLLNPERAHKEGLTALRARGGRIAADPPTELAGADLVIDGIVGISGTGPLRPAAAELVAALTAPIVAVDLPSGVDPDTGTVSGPAVTAAVTVCPGAYKRVHALAAARCGRIVLVPIGLELPVLNLSRRSARPGLDADFYALEPHEVGELWPVPGADDDKYTQGVVGICAGSDRYPGAGVLSVGGAVAATSGMVRYAGSAAAQVLSAHPEVVAAPTVAAAGKVQAWVAGPGAGTDDAALAVLREVLSHDGPVLVDADGLTVLAAHPDLVRGRSAPTLLTPHAGEFRRLTGNDPAADRVAATRALAADWNVTVLLKGRATVIAAPDGRTFVNEAGGSWAATAGAGDVLSGVVGALLASGLEPAVAAAAGARAHALAANLAASGSGRTSAPVSASALSAQLSAAIRVLRQHATRS